MEIREHAVCALANMALSSDNHVSIIYNILEGRGKGSGEGGGGS